MTSFPPCLIDPNLNYFDSTPRNVMLKIAIKQGYLGLFERLLTDKFEDPSANDSEVLYLAFELGHLDILKKLLEDGRADPSKKDNLLIQMASCNGYYEIVEMLLKDPRVDPFANHLFSICKARTNGHKRIVELLLPAFEEYVYRQKEEKGIDVPAVLLAAIAFEQGRPEIIRRILERGFDPFINCNCLLNQSRRHSYPDLEQLVLKAMVNAFIKNISSYFSSLWAIAEKGTLDRLDRFLAHKKIEPLFDSNASIRAAFREGLARAAEIAVDGHRRAALERLLKDKKLFNFRASDNAELLDMKEKHRNLVQYAKEHSPKMVDILSTVAL